jgi:hypothetical protein
MRKTIAAIELCWSALVAVSMVALIPYATYWDPKALIRGVILSVLFALSPLAVALGAALILANRWMVFSIYLMLLGSSISTAWVGYIVVTLSSAQISLHWKPLPMIFLALAQSHRNELPKARDLRP